MKGSEEAANTGRNKQMPKGQRNSDMEIGKAATGLNHSGDRQASEQASLENEAVTQMNCKTGRGI